MRLDEWQKYIDSEFVADARSKREKEVDQGSEPDLQTSAPEDERTDLPENQAADKEQEDALQVAEVPVIVDSPPVTVRHEQSAIVYPEIDYVIPSFDRYLPSGHPAHSGALQPEPKANSAAPTEAAQTSQEPASHAECPDSAVPDLNAAANSPREAPEERPEPARSGVEVTSSVRAKDLLSSLAALGRLYDSVTRSAPEASDTSLAPKQELLERLMNPVLTMDEAARLLDVTPTTIRRYTNRGLLPCFRQGAEQTGITRVSGRESRHRRFRLSDILLFLETRQATLQADHAKERIQKEQGRTWLV